LMDNYDFFSTFVTAVGRNDTLSTWAQVHFGSKVQVFSDLPAEDPPGADDMPYVILHTPGVAKHQERREQSYTISADLGLNKGVLATRAEDNIEEPAGIELILDFVTIFIEAVEGALPANTSFGYTMQADTLGSLPEVYAFVDLEFIMRITLGGDPLG